MTPLPKIECPSCHHDLLDWDDEQVYAHHVYECAECGRDYCDWCGSASRQLCEACNHQFETDMLEYDQMVMAAGDSAFAEDVVSKVAGQA